MRAVSMFGNSSASRATGERIHDISLSIPSDHKIESSLACLISPQRRAKGRISPSFTMSVALSI
jgi:hypothetical protein